MTKQDNDISCVASLKDTLIKMGIDDKIHDEIIEYFLMRREHHIRQLKYWETKLK